MNLNNDAKKRLREFSRAVNRAVKESPEAQRALDELRTAGYDASLKVKLESLPEPADSDEKSGGETAFTDSDRRELGRMLIRVK